MITRVKSWLRSTLNRRRLEEDMDHEVQFHIDAPAADLRRSGLAPEQAKRQAHLEFGTIASVTNNRVAFNLPFLLVVVL
jgi:hypothetical protein